MVVENYCGIATLIHRKVGKTQRITFRQNSQNYKKVNLKLINLLKNFHLDLLGILKFLKIPILSNFRLILRLKL
jgi:hypothetical protein